MTLRLSSRFIKTLVALLLAAHAAPPAAHAASMPQLTADHTMVTTSDGARFVGNARLEQDDITLTADEIIYQPKTHTATARGHVTFTRLKARLLAEEATYNVETKEFNITHLRAGQFPLYISGDQATGTTSHLTVTNAHLHYGEPDALSPTLSTTTLTIDQDTRRLTAGSGRIGLGTDTAAIPTPPFSQDLNDPAIRYLTFDAGYRSSIGAFINTSYIPPVGEGIRAGADLGLYTKRGVLIGPALNYNTLRPATAAALAATDPDTFADLTATGTTDTPLLGATGALRSGYIHDFGDLDQDINGNDISTNRGYIEWKHHQLLTPSLTLNANINYWSDSEITRDYRRDQFRTNQVPDTFAELYQTGSNHTASLFLRANPNDAFQMQQRLPELRFDGHPVALGAGIYHRLNASLAILEQKTVTGPDAPPPPANPANNLRSTRADIYYSAVRPFTPTEWLTLSPVAGGRITYYDRATGGKDNYTRVLGELGFDAEARTSATWEYKNTTWDIDGLRHLVTPKLSYRYIPDADKGRPYIPQIDDRPFDTYLAPLGLGNQRNIDELSAANAARLALDNTLQTRDPLYGSRDLARLTLATDYYFDDAANQTTSDNNFSDLHIGLTLTPVRWLQFDLYQRLALDNLALNELNTGLTLRDADAWWIRFGQHYLHDVDSEKRIQEFLLSAGYTFNEAWSALVLWRYDTRQNRFTEQSYSLVQRLTRVWTLRYVLSFYEGNDRDGDIGFGVRVDMTNF
ncbi:LPS-assembly protein LptD [Opitutaceae bacterium TAV4]|nr:LPS-assembly protein LptD [Opitutaceae bacterium TAV4]